MDTRRQRGIMTVFQHRMHTRLWRDVPRRCARHRCVRCRFSERGDDVVASVRGGWRYALLAQAHRGVPRTSSDVVRTRAKCGGARGARHVCVRRDADVRCA
jgi:hypothetical protein